MQLTSPTFIVAGLSNGCFAGWNLQTNQMDEFKAHEYPVTSLHLHQTFLVSGDSNGIVKVFDTSNFSVLLEGKANVGYENQQKPCAITSLDIIEKPQLGGPLVVAGDNLGNITLIRKDLSSNLIQSVTMGAHAEKTPKEVIKVLKLPETNDLVSVGASGFIRLWMQ